MPFSVYFWLMRHGEKTSRNADELSEFGVEQVEASTKRYLCDFMGRLELICHSGTARTERSADIVFRVRREFDTFTYPPRLCRAIGYHGLYDDPNIPSWDFVTLEDELYEEHDGAPSAYDWLRKMPPAWGARHAMRCWMKDTFERLHLKHVTDTPRHIIGLSHDPIVALAAPRPDEIGPVGTADIVRYEVVQHEPLGEPEIQQPLVFHCPLQRKT